MVAKPSATATAPTSPPIRAWEVLEGKPKYQVNRFHKIALVRAAMITALLIAAGSTTSLPIVVATATPKRKGPAKWAAALMSSAIRGETARDEIIVATMLLASWKPFRKSKTKAIAIMTIRRVGMIWQLSPEVPLG
jgi:hypothetical protein